MKLYNLADIKSLIASSEKYKNKVESGSNPDQLMNLVMNKLIHDYIPLYFAENPKACDCLCVNSCASCLGVIKHILEGNYEVF